PQAPSNSSAIRATAMPSSLRPAPVCSDRARPKCRSSARPRSETCSTLYKSSSPITANSRRPLNRIPEPPIQCRSKDLMRIGITCYPTYGGSGVVATELGIELAQRGHQVHFISYSQPIRLTQPHPNIHFHEVEVSRYPLFEYPPYDLALA